MTENEFLQEYKNRLESLANSYALDITSDDKSHYNERFYKYIELSTSFSYHANLLISQMMEECNLDYDAKVYEGHEMIEISKVLLKRSSSIQLEYRRLLNEKTIPFLREALCRDFPDDCHKQGILP